MGPLGEERSGPGAFALDLSPNVKAKRSASAVDVRRRSDHQVASASLGFNELVGVLTPEPDRFGGQMRQILLSIHDVQIVWMRSG